MRYMVQTAEIREKPDQYGNKHYPYHVFAVNRTAEEVCADIYYLEQCGMNIDIEVVDENSKIVDLKNFEM